MACNGGRQAPRIPRENTTDQQVITTQILADHSASI